MEAQMHRPHSVPEEAGEVEHHGEKKSVLKKVKAKAKKIKESIKHLGHDHEHDNEVDDADADEEYDDEEIEDDPEVHGAPIYESSAIRSGAVPNQDIGMAPKPVVNLEKPTSTREDRFDPNVTIEDKMRQFARPTGDEREMDRVPVEHESHVPPSSRTHHVGIERTEREPGARFGVLTGLQEDPQAPTDKPNPSNYESKVTDPTNQRGEEAGVPPLVASFGKMTVEDETKPKSSAKAVEQKSSYSGSHDQFSPEAIPTSTLFGPESTTKRFDSGKPEDDMPRDTIDGKSPGGPGGSNYSDKIASAATVLADKATTAKNVVASKMGYGDGTDEKGTHTSLTDSAHKAAAAVTETLAPIYGKVAGVGSVVVSKVPGISTDEKRFTESSASPESNKTRVTMREYFAEKLPKPGEEDKALSEVISDSLKGGVETGGRNPIGKVTESEEVARRLGSGQENRREGSDALKAGSESTGGSSVVDQIKEAVTSWVMKGGESPTSHQGAPATSLGK